MQKIVFCINKLEMGGAEKMLLEIVRSLFKIKKYEITVVTSEETESYISEEIKKYSEYKFMISKQDYKKKFFCNGLKTLYISLKKKYKINKYLKGKNVVIDFLDCDFYKYIKPLKKIKKIVWLHSDFEYLKSRKKGIEKKIGDYDKIITVCDEILMKIKNEQNNLEKKLVRIYNSFDYDMIEEQTIMTDTEKDNHLLNSEYFLTVCRLDERDKDVRTLIKAFEKYEGKEKLYILGDGIDKKNLENLSKEMIENGRIVFLGLKKNPYIWMRKSNTFILSSKAEGFGLVLAEALYLGTKVISSNCASGPSEVLENGKLGKLFEVGNKEELFMQLNKIKEFKVERKDVLESLKRFDINIVVQEIMEVLDANV